MHDNLAVESQEEDFTNATQETERGMLELPARSGKNSTMRVPPEGTMPRNHLDYPYGPGDFAKVKEEVKNTQERNYENLRRGQVVYNSQCAVCHGYLGYGDGPVTLHFPNVPSLQSAIIKNWSDGEIFHMITMGRGRMFPFSAQIIVEDRWNTIHYIRYLQEQEPRTEDKDRTTAKRDQ